MGGLLAAEAATDSSNAPNERIGHSRIVAVIDFDTPFLGMHPHVIISGIASLLPKDRKTGGKKESEMNQHPAINIVPERVTDDWENFRQKAGTETLSPLTTSSSAYSPRSTPPSRSPSPFFDRVLDFASAYSDRSFVRRLKNHSDHPVSSGKQWVVEHLQFGGAMFDTSGLKERYRRLVAWKDGTWVNYWTTTWGGTSSEEGSEAGQLAYNDRGLLESGIIESSAPGTPSSLIDQEWRNHIKKSNETSGKKRGRHFIVLPTGLGKIMGGERCWEKVIIRGVEDEVAAHCGIFIREQNLDYDGFLGRVGAKVIQLCEAL
ncbi:hypothetical protein AGABI2DRAFT_153208 [Agaricus bisporus var. bisporus H97]|uniref:hypothetical protein n=1 Tax=Agaricus bisporus var. bisporus (strain H97 / ATCC MYA-4626 / FGSC 10389) TaxID=936046 RepID=UPI00029F629C|nr:hypothetical protein AGABI2DRAFT_153208 [Agaricus bisporus var. bisporus H97]EKV43891.1 hypothetical protein AGABI2DRAFT_153208 [Agaricus bisporus var. bisporus H97]